MIQVQMANIVVVRQVRALDLGSSSSAFIAFMHER